MENSKIAVIGLGGVGGYIGALLAKKYENVTFIVRKNRGEQIKEKGLTLHSDYNGEIKVMPENVVYNGEKFTKQDYIFICVKNYSLEEACENIKDMVSDDTVIVPVMNGVDPGNKIRKLIGKGIVLDSLIYIISFIDENGNIVQQGDNPHIHIGHNENGIQEIKHAKEVCRSLKDAGIPCAFEEDIEAAIWKKYMLNCAYNVATACYNEPIGMLRKDEKKAKEYEALVWEAYNVAKKKGVNLKEEDAKRVIYRFYYEHADNATSSLQRDVWAGRRTEIETFCGYLVREGNELSVSVPVMTQMYENIMSVINQ